MSALQTEPLQGSGGVVTIPFLPLPLVKNIEIPHVRAIVSLTEWKFSWKKRKKRFDFPFEIT